MLQLHTMLIVPGGILKNLEFQNFTQHFCKIKCFYSYSNHFYNIFEYFSDLGMSPKIQIKPKKWQNENSLSIIYQQFTFKCDNRHRGTIALFQGARDLTTIGMIRSSS